MNPHSTRLVRTVLAVACLAATPTLAEQIVLEGRPAIFGGLPADVFVPQFDDFGGDLTLNSVTFESLSSMRGGYVVPRQNRDGCVDWWMEIQVDYYLDFYATPELLNSSGCVQSGQTNCTPSPAEQAVDVFCSSGWVPTVITDPAKMARWIGFGEVIVTADPVAYDFGDSPTGIIGFGAGGSALYRVTYDYTEGGTTCPCERDGDPTQVDIFDLLAYLSDWFAASPTADLDNNAATDIFDLLAFLDCWFATSGGACI